MQGGLSARDHDRLDDAAPATGGHFLDDDFGIEGRGADRIMARLTAMAQVTAVHSTNGRWDLIVDLAAGSLSELDDVLRRIRDLDGVMTSETNLILSTRRAGTR